VDDGDLKCFGGNATGIFPTTAANPIEIEVTVAAQQTQIAATSSAQSGIWLLAMYIRVTAACNVTALAAWWDPNGNQQTAYFQTAAGVQLNNAALAVGSYACVVLSVANIGTVAQPRQVQTFLTASVANAVFGSSSVTKVG
jgi:hypothetical protein